MEQRNSNYERNKNRLLIGTKGNFYSTKIMFKLVNKNRASRQRFRRRFHLIWINERKDMLKRKSDQKSRSEIIAKNPRKRKTDEQINERTFVN